MYTTNPTQQLVTWPIQKLVHPRLYVDLYFLNWWVILFELLFTWPWLFNSHRLIPTRDTFMLDLSRYSWQMNIAIVTQAKPIKPNWIVSMRWSQPDLVHNTPHLTIWMAYPVFVFKTTNSTLKVEPPDPRLDQVSNSRFRIQKTRANSTSFWISCFVHPRTNPI